MNVPEGYCVVWKHWRVPYSWAHSAYNVTKRCPSRDLWKVVELYHPSDKIKFTPHTHGGCTECYIYDANRQFVASGEATCSLKDQFVYKIGRQISLGRALKHLRGE